MAEDTSWTEARLEKLRKLWDQGLSISQIGEELGVTRNAIAGKAHRLGLPKRQSPINSKAKAAPKEEKVEQVDMNSRELPLRLALRRISWSRNACASPSGDPKTLEFSFCGEKIEPGKPYCTEHCEMAYSNTRDGS